MEEIHDLDFSWDDLLNEQTDYITANQMCADRADCQTALCVFQGTFY